MGHNIIGDSSSKSPMKMIKFTNSMCLVILTVENMFADQLLISTACFSSPERWLALLIF